MNVVHFLLKRTGIKKINPHAVAGLIILCLSVAPILAFAGAMYICTDQDGNQIVTNAPREGMSNCVLKYPAEDSSPRANITSHEGPSRSVNITSHGDPSPEAKIASMRKRAAMSICNHIAFHRPGLRTGQSGFRFFRKSCRNGSQCHRLVSRLVSDLRVFTFYIARHKISSKFVPARSLS
jgi:hypothetical protein